MSPAKTAAQPRAATIGGVLAWGQSGNYNAVDDRAVITALFAAGRGSGGLVLAPTLAAQAGLTIGVGPWQAVVDCGDGTKAVIGSRAATSIDETAGGASARADVLWADISPDGATYTVSLIPESAVAGRAGCFLGLVLVPASAGTAAAMDLRPGNARNLGPRKATFPNLTCTQTTYQTMASMVIPAYDAEVGAIYQIEVWGAGVQGSPRAGQTWTPSIGGQTSGVHSVNFGTTAFQSPGGTAYRQAIRARLVCQAVGTAGKWYTFIEGGTSDTDFFLAPGNNNFAWGNDSNSQGDPATSTFTQDTTRDATFAVSTLFATGGTGATFTSRVAIAQRVA